MPTLPNLPTVEVERDGDIAYLRLSRPPVNAIDSSLLRDLAAALDALEASDVQGVILCGRPKVFSAGLDLPALLAFDDAAMIGFWRQFCGTFARLWRTPLCVVAAVEGHAPAGGTVLCLAADHIVMGDGAFTFGLNEVAVGLAVPRFLCRVAEARLGHRHAGRLLTTGALVSPSEARDVGYVDELVAPERVLATAVERLQQRLALPHFARRATKAALREPLAAAIEAGIEAEVASFLQAWREPTCQAQLRAVVERLQRREART